MADDQETRRLRKRLDALRTSHRPLTAEERAALDARDRSLLERFMARDREASRELVKRLGKLGENVAWRLWPRLSLDWESFQGAYFEVLYRYREEGLLRLDEPLVFLAQRLLKQAGRKAGIEAHRELMALRFHCKGMISQELRDKLPADEDASWNAWLEKQAQGSVAAQPRFGSPEAAVGSAEQLAWIEAAVAKLSPSERATFEAEAAVARGEHESLAAALGVAEGTAYNRRAAMRASLRRMAEADGETEIVERLKARAPRKPRK